MFAERGGFDLIAGNPPWVKVEWNEGGILSERNPSFAIRKLSASKIAEERGSQLEDPGRLEDYLAEYEEAAGTQAFLNSLQNYSLLKGQQTNLYKCFISRAWQLMDSVGTTAFLHPEGVYDDPKGGMLRKILYKRLRHHLQFTNVRLLFSEVMIWVKYSINIYGNEAANPFKFISMSNLFSPTTVDASYNYSGSAPPGGIKTSTNEWNTEGHESRCVEIGEDQLRLFAELYDKEGTPYLQARLPALHSKHLVDVLKKFAAYPRRLAHLEGEYLALEMWHETNAQKDHTIRRETSFPAEPRELILSGPHFFVGKPLHRTPRQPCPSNQAYDILDLETLPDDYLPRTNYRPDCPPEEYHRRTPSVPWDPTKKVTDYYRCVSRTMLSQSGERTLISSIAQKGVASIDNVFSLPFSDQRNLLRVVSAFNSVPCDFWVKTTGKGHNLIATKVCVVLQHLTVN